MKRENEDIKNVKKIPIAAVLITGAFLAILNQTLLATALPPIMEELDLTENTAQWLTTIFMLVNGIMVPITAFLIDTFTSRRLFLTAMSAFAAGTLLCAIAPSFAILMIGRIIQAAGAGVMMPLMMTIFLLIFPVERRGSAMGMVGLVIGFAPALGPVLSGWLIEHYHWRFLFYIVLPLAVANVIAGIFVMKNVTEQTFPKVDVLSIILSTLGFGGFLYGFSSAGNYGWTDPAVIGTIVVGSISLFFFITRQLKLEQPILEFHIFKNRIFTFTTVIGMIGFMGLIGSETILPIYMQSMVGFTAMETGLMILPGALIMGFMSPINGRIFDRYGAKNLMIIGMALITVTSFLFARLTPETTLTYLTVVFAIRMLGISMVLMPSATAGINQLSVRLIPHGTAMSNTMRQMAASIGTAILVTIMTSAALNGSAEPAAMDRIHGVNISFYTATFISLAGLILAFLVKGSTPQQDRDNLKAAESKQVTES